MTAKALAHIIKGRTIRKVMGGGGGEKAKKKFMQGKMPRKKIRAKKKGKKKNSCRRNNKHVKMHGVDRPARLPLCVRCVDKNLFSFAFTSMSLSDFSFVSEILPF